MAKPAPGEGDAVRPPFDPVRMRQARTEKIAAQKAQGCPTQGGFTLTPDFIRQGGSQGAGFRLTKAFQPDRFFRTEALAQEWAANWVGNNPDWQPLPEPPTARLGEEKV